MITIKKNPIFKEKIEEKNWKIKKKKKTKNN